MANEVDVEATLAYPNPPFVLFSPYTNDNVDSGATPKPPLPVKGSYQMFGAPFHTTDAMIRPLEDQGIQRLYPQDYDKKTELKKLNRSILVCFLELLDILISNPSSSERNKKIHDLSVLFINMHHLINEYRPHQARETLRVILERQKKQREEMTMQIHQAMDKAKTILKSCDSLLSHIVSSIVPIGDEESVVSETAIEMDTEDTREITTDVTTSLSPVDKQDTDLCNLIDSVVKSYSNH